MKCPRKCCVLLFLVVTIAAVALRLPRLGLRPMHSDEAVGAVKFGALLEKGFYRYNPGEYHGPTLNYLTLIPAWLGSTEKFAEVTEFTLRIVPVFFGVSLVLLLLLLVDGMGWAVVICAAVLTAVSPAFVFYSRYYIQEMLLVCFTFAAIVCGYRYTQSKNIKWALLTGMFLGLTYATKETCIIVFGSMLSALVLTLLMRRRQNGSADFTGTVKTINRWHLIAALTVAAIVSSLFYSSFFTNPGGIADSVRAYATYFNRAVTNTPHNHPWYYYLKILIYSRYGSGPLWSEALIVILAGIGFIVAMTRKGCPGVNSCLLRFIAFYTAIMTVLYSVIPYKTPWCLLGFLHGMILLAAVGAVSVIKFSPNVLVRLLISLLLIAGGGHLARQGWLASFKYYADPANPYVYAHTSTDVYTITRRVKEAAQVHPDGFEMYIQVICPDDDYWPLPWYLRRFDNIRWQNKVEPDVPIAPLIIASASVESGLVNKLYEVPPPGKKHLYVPLFDSYIELRPQVELRGFVTKDMWDKIENSKQ